MLEYMVAETIAREHMEELAESLEKERLLQENMPSKRRLSDRVIIYMAGLLISMGVWLQGRYRPMRSPEPEADSLSC